MNVSVVFLLFIFFKQKKALSCASKEKEIFILFLDNSFLKRRILENLKEPICVSVFFFVQ
jgi:hypothetical protein